MGKRTVLTSALLLCLCLPVPGLADCVNLAHFNRFYVQEDDTVIFYYNNMVLGTIELQDCTAESSSDIRLTKNFVCEGDNILVDGENCTLLSVTIE